MLKTLRTRKYMMLDELIDYVRNNYEEVFESEELRTFTDVIGELRVTFKDSSTQIEIESNQSIDLHTKFIVETEEEITKHTVFEELVELYCEYEEYRTLTYTNKSIDYVEDGATVFIYALIDNKLELIFKQGDKNAKNN